MKRIVFGIFFLSFFLIGTSLISMENATTYNILTQYYGHYRQGYFYPLNEIMNFDVPAENLTFPGAYPYVFTLNTSLHVYLEIRHFLWAYNANYSNHLTIWIDNRPILQANSPRAACPNNWYPGGNGVQFIDLGTRSAGIHLLTMTCNISDCYTLNWWSILTPVDPIVHGQPITHSN